MRLLFVADGRSPIALNWITWFIVQGHDVHLATTFACPRIPGLASLTLIPAAFSGMKSGGGEPSRRPERGTSSETPPVLGGAAEPVMGVQKDWTSLGTVGLRTTIRQWFGPLTLKSAARRLQELILRLQPELVHAMRIPYEGMVAGLSRPTMPLLISIWGNDFTLHARSTPLMGYLTRQALQAASALHTDCWRDLRLAEASGYPADRPRLVVPGNGGIRLEVFYPPADDELVRANRPATVINPRGMRAYVRNDTFFKALPRVLAVNPNVRFICPTMAGNPEATRWVSELGIAGQVELLPRQSQAQMAELFRESWVAVSPSEHDGTPNTLLEAMACGCFPVAGDIESLHEWITPGDNGLLVDPGDPAARAEAILQGLEQPELRQRARRQNLGMIASRAEYRQVMPQVEKFYRQLL
jgi:glycosyltransferase involved in cell wall biosynthesis